MVKTARAYKSSKRSRELARQKKQEEKRLRRLARHENPSPDEALPEQESEPGQEPQAGVETPEGEVPGEGENKSGTPETD